MIEKVGVVIESTGGVHDAPQHRLSTLIFMYARGYEKLKIPLGTTIHIENDGRQAELKWRYMHVKLASS